MLRSTFALMLGMGIMFTGLIAPASAATPSKPHTGPTIAARQAALAQAKKRRHHHHKKTTAIAAVRTIG
jgi:hypothetical protein